MEKKRIIPCLDLKDGLVVKGVNFVNFRQEGDPLELALYYDREGADELVLLDITATMEKRTIFLQTIKEIASRVSLPLTVGGGIRTVEEIGKLLEAGARKVSISSAAVNNPALVQEAAAAFGKETIVVAIDAKKSRALLAEEKNLSGDRENEIGAENIKSGWEVFIQAGKKATGMDLVAWAKRVEELGAGEILLTSMDKDGTREGYDLDLLQAVTGTVSIPVIASGGAGKLEDFRDAFLRGKAAAVLAASIFHEREFRIREVKEYLQAVGIPVQL